MSTIPALVVVIQQMINQLIVSTDEPCAGDDNLLATIILLIGSVLPSDHQTSVLKAVALYVSSKLGIVNGQAYHNFLEGLSTIIRKEGLVKCSHVLKIEELVSTYGAYHATVCLCSLSRPLLFNDQALVSLVAETDWIMNFLKDEDDRLWGIICSWKRSIKSSWTIDDRVNAYRKLCSTRKNKDACSPVHASAPQLD